METSFLQKVKYSRDIGPQAWELVLQHDENAVLCAVEMALTAGVPTKTHVLNLLYRLVDGKAITPPTIDAPRALMLTNE